jgi:excisionase family DNA binding protein
MSKIEKHYSIRKAAELLGISQVTIRRRIADGSLPAVLIAANCTRISESALEQFLQERTIISPEIGHDRFSYSPPRSLCRNH